MSDLEIFTQKIDIVSKAPQEPGIELNTIIKLYDSLVTHFHDTRNRFETFESKAKILTKSDYRECTQRQRVRKRFDAEVVDNTDPGLNLIASV